MDWSPQAPLSMGFSRQEYWSGLSLPSPVWWLEMVYKSQAVCLGKRNKVVLEPNLLQGQLLCLSLRAPLGSDMGMLGHWLVSGWLDDGSREEDWKEGRRQGRKAGDSSKEKLGLFSTCLRKNWPWRFWAGLSSTENSNDFVSGHMKISTSFPWSVGLRLPWEMSRSVHSRARNQSPAITNKTSPSVTEWRAANRAKNLNCRTQLYCF